MSRVEVDKIQQQCGTTLTVGGGACKTAVVDATTVTLGRSGGTVSLASGATQSGFGRTGTVDWQTGSIKTAGFTPTNGEGYFCDTSAGAFAVTLPAGVAGNIVAFADYTRSFGTYILTITPNGSEKMGGVSQSAELSVDGQSATFVYVDGTEGWINVQETQTSVAGVPPYIGATGGCITYSGNFKIHTFNAPGDFNVTRVATQAPTPEHNTVSYLVVGSGGGAGSFPLGGGGGAGGFREGKNSPICSYTASPLEAPAGGIPVSASPYPITVGGGGAGGSPGPLDNGVIGNNSTFGPITSNGGGYGAGANSTPGGAGASGGGGQGNCAATTGGAGNTPPTSPAQGFVGGAARTVPGCRGGGGGGGATQAGQNGSPPYTGGPGGAGATTEITASPVAYAGGGGGAGQGCAPARGGAGGAGGGGAAQDSSNPTADSGTDNTGGGGGGGAWTSVGGSGGSGVVIIRYRYQ